MPYKIIVTDSAHPSVEKLRTFGLGQLDEAEAAVIEEHVSHCDACCRTLTDVGSDTFTDLLRLSREAPLAVNATEAPTVAPEAGTPGLFAVSGQTSADSPAEPASSDPPPEVLQHPRYRILGMLGAGGMGSVYKAEHRLMERVVALKVMNSALLANAATVERFRREFKAAALLSHPNIVAAYDAEQAGDVHFLVMEYVQGVDLARWLAERGPLPVAEACEYARQCAAGLQHAHEHGMIHRDIKPHNLMRARDGTVKILDFGLARLAAEAGAAPSGVTGQGTLLGTVDYLAPEQADDARQADIRSDIYSLGCTLYHLLSGRPPFFQGTLVQKIMAHTQRDPLSLQELRPDLPPGLTAVVARTMAKLPADRYQTPAEVCTALAPFADGTFVLDLRLLEKKHAATRQVSRSSRRRRWPIAVAVLLLGLLGLAGAAAIYHIQTDNGELVITTGNPDVEVVIKQNGRLVKIIDTKTNKEVTLASGLYELELKGQPDDLKLSLDKVTIRRGETVVATVERRPTKLAEKVGEVRRFLGFAPDHWVPRAVFSPDGRRVVAASGEVRVWDATSGQALMVLGDVKAFGWGLALAPDCKTTYKSTDDGVVHIFDMEKAKEVGRLDAPGRGPSLLQISADGKRILITVRPKHRLCELPGGKELGVFEGGQEAALSPDGTQVALYRDKRIVLWDAISGKEVGGFERSLEGDMPGFRFTPDGHSLVAAGVGPQRSDVRMWDVATGRERASFTVPDVPAGKFLHVAVSPDGRRILTGADPSWPATNPPIILWDVKTAKEVRRFAGPENGVFSLAFSPDGRSAVATGADGTVRLLRLPDPPEEKVGEVRRFEGHRGPVRTVAYSADGRYVLSGSGWPAGDNTVRLWDVVTGNEVRRFQGHTDFVIGVALSADGRWALSGSFDRSIRLWDVATGEEVRRFVGHELGVMSVAFSPGGRYVLSGSQDGTVRLWDVDTAKQVRKFDGHNGWVESVAFSPDGHRVVSSGTDVHLWEVETGKELRRFGVHHQDGVVVAYSPDGRFLLSGGVDNTVRLWDVETGKEVRSFKGHTLQITSVAFSPDGRRALSGSWDRTVRLWDAGTGKELHCFEGHLDAVWGIAFSPDGRYALSGSGGSYHNSRNVRGDEQWGAGRDWTLRLWRLPDPSGK